VSSATPRSGARSGVNAARCAAALAAAGAALWAWGRAEVERPRDLDAVLAGPLAPTLAAAQWTRAVSAVHRGELGAGLARARGALALSPRSGPLWGEYAWLLALHLGSAEREPDQERRADWLRAGLAALDESARASGDAGGCEFARGILLYTKAQTDPELAWPGGTDALRAAAVAAIDRARVLGNAAARELSWQGAKGDG
jgi:hypothetical protein